MSFHFHVSRTQTVAAVFVLVLLVTGMTALAVEKRERRGYLGVSIERISSDEKKEMGLSHGVRVFDVMKGSPAEEAGILEDDIIQFFGDAKINTTENLVDAVRATKPESQVNIVLMRDGQKKEVSVTVGKTSRSFYTLKSPSEHRIRIVGFGGAYLGVQLQDLNTDLAAYFGVDADQGILVLDVTDESPAEKAGLKSGDVIVEVDDDPVSDAQDIKEILKDFEEGDEINVVVVRQKKRQTFKVTLEELEHGPAFHIFEDRMGGRSRRRDIWVPDLEEIDEDIHLEIEELEDADFDHEKLEHIEFRMQEMEERMRDRMDAVSKRTRKIII